MSDFCQTYRHSRESVNLYSQRGRKHCHSDLMIATLPSLMIATLPSLMIATLPSLMKVSYDKWFSRESIFS